MGKGFRKGSTAIIAFLVMSCSTVDKTLYSNYLYINGKLENRPTEIYLSDTIAVFNDSLFPITKSYKRTYYSKDLIFRLDRNCLKVSKRNESPDDYFMLFLR